MTASVDCVEVLIAEADPWTANLLQQLVLDVCGDARVLQVSDGQAALARCKRRLPDLVIADGELPGLDGLELLRQLRRVGIGAARDLLAADTGAGPVDHCQAQFTSAIGCIPGYALEGFEGVVGNQQCFVDTQRSVHGFGLSNGPKQQN